MQFYKDILFWIPGTPFEFNLIFILSIIILYKHHTNLIGFLKNNYLDLERTNDNFLFLSE